MSTDKDRGSGRHWHDVIVFLVDQQFAQVSFERHPARLYIENDMAGLDKPYTFTISVSYECNVFWVVESLQGRLISWTYVGECGPGDMVQLVAQEE